MMGQHRREEQMLFDFAYDGLEEEAKELLDQYLGEAWKRAKSLNWVIEPTLFSAGRRILTNGRRLQAAVLILALTRLLPSFPLRRRDSGALLAPLAKLVSRIARRKLPLRQEEAEEIVVFLADHARRFTYAIPVLGVLRVVQRHVDAYGFTKGLESSLCRLQSVWLHDWYFNNLRKIQGRIATIAEAKREPS